MRFIISLLFASVLFGMVACTGPGNTVTRQAKIIPFETRDLPLPVDSNIVIGELENGLRYYIRKNGKPEQRAELRLVINAGSILEDEDQLGLAHFVEHMAFNGTENFEKQELVDYLESIGMRFGPDLNAYTSFDETVYMLQIPTDSVEIIKTAFEILEEWAHRVSFDSTEVVKERGVVLEEWRSGRGAQARMFDKQFPILFKDSRYADRLPIGKPEIIENADAVTLERYYRDWYRPDLMAVIAVGDINKNQIETLIHDHFTKLKNPESARARNLFPVPGHPETLTSIVTDPEATSNTISVYYKIDPRPQDSESAYRQSLVEGLFFNMFNQRLDELRKLPEPPFLFGFAGSGNFVRSKDVIVLSAGVQDNGMETGLEAMLIEAARARKFGFTASELERGKTDMLRGIEQAYNERDKSESRGYAAEYIRNFLTQEPIPGIEYEFQLYKKHVPGITLEEVNALAKELIREENRVILGNAPEKEGLSLPEASDLVKVFRDVGQQEIEAYVDEVSDEPLMATIPAPGSIVEENELADLDVSHWKLSNGINVYLKATDFKNDEIGFMAFSPGGHSLVEDEDYIAANTATSIVTQSGLAGFTQTAFEKKLAGKVVSVSPWIGGREEGFSGSASPQDVETMFQVLNLYVTAPRQDSSAYLSYQTRIKAFLANMNANPQKAFRDTIAVTMAQNHFRARPISEDFLNEMDMQRSFEIYRERFADASDFTFIFVGNIDKEAFRPLVSTYLASLPTLDRQDTPRDLGIRPPKGVIKKTVRKGLEPKSQVQIIFTGEMDWNRQNRYDLNSMTSVMRIKLREVLREDKGGTYGVGIRSSSEREPEGSYRLTITFGCSPDRVDELIGDVMIQVDSLRNFPVDASYITKVKETQRRERELNLKENGYWRNALSFYLRNDLDLAGILNGDDFTERLNAAAVHNAAKLYLDKQNYVQVVLYPEGGTQ